MPPRPPGAKKKGKRAPLLVGDGKYDLRGPDSPDDDPVLATFPCNGEGIGTVKVHFGWVGQFRAAYPGIDLAQETLKAHAWIVGNPTRRKTARGLSAFLTGWYSRATNRGR